MLDFLVLSLPRSGSTWAANWLTTGGALCLHDPLAHRTQADLLNFSLRRVGSVGAACTALWLWPDWCARHARRVLILDRDPASSQNDLYRLGLPLLPDWAIAKFAAMPGLRVPYTDLFDHQLAPAIWRHLRPREDFDHDRYNELVDMSIEPDFRVWRPNLDLTDSIFRDLDTG